MGSYHQTSVLGWLKFGDLVSLILFSIFFCFVVLLRSIPQNVWTVDLPRCKPNQVVVLLKILSFYIVTGKRTSLLCLFPAKVGILMRPWQRFNPKWWIITLMTTAICHSVIKRSPLFPPLWRRLILNRAPFLLPSQQ